MLLIFLLTFLNQAQILNINYERTPKKDVKSIRMFNAAKRSLDNLSIIPVVTRLFLHDKVPLTYRQVPIIK